MNKTDILLQMLEQPQRYTADEWQQILADEECRELYTLMSKTQSAVDAARADEEVTDEMVDAEWQKLTPRSLSFSLSAFQKAAAMFVGILLLSGIAFATIHFLNNTAVVREDMQYPAHEARISNASQQPVHFDDVRLDSILMVVSAHYGKAVVFRDKEPRSMKFITTWNPADSLAAFIDHLNMFDYLHLTLRSDTIFVEQTSGEEGK